MRRSTGAAVAITRDPGDATSMPRNRFGGLWAWPIALGAASAFGLVAALLADSWWDLLSTAALATPLAVAIGCIARKPHGSARAPARPRQPFASNQEPGSR